MQARQRIRRGALAVAGLLAGLSVLVAVSVALGWSLP
jgi:hypothetical protein